MWYSSKTWTFPMLSLVPTKVKGTIPCVNKTQKQSTHVNMGIKRKRQVHQKPRCSSMLTSCRGCLLSLSPSILTLTTPDLSTISWMTLPFFPITLPEDTHAGKRWEVQLEAVHMMIKHKALNGWANIYHRFTEFYENILCYVSVLINILHFILEFCPA